ncbi:MAG: serine/threonine-protein kinase [Gemmatimonadaceae bacterium]
MLEGTELGARLQAALGDAYIVRGELAAGGMARVFRARDTRADREVALKVLRPEVAASLGSQRFRHEIAVASRLDHPNILAVHDHGEGGGDLLWYAMPLLEGETLRERMTRESQLPLDDALRIARDVAGALEYAHASGYMHRDVKPDNIMVSAHRQTLLADFGIARPMHDETGTWREGLADAKVATTTTGFVVGSPQYMSPEQVGGDPSLDGRTDQYSLGIVLYEMLAGEPPFGGRNAQAVVSKMFASGPPSIRVVRPDVPVTIDDALKRALSRSRQDRFGSISDFAAALHIASREARGGIGGAVSRLAKRLRVWRARE